MGRPYVGTSGWSYEDWRKDFYPPGLPSREWLPFLAARFDTVELNASFYRVPQKATVERWSSIVPPGFRFSVKLWRGFTHRHRLVDPEGRLDWFFSSIEPIRPGQRAALLVQLPPQMEVDAQRLDAFLSLLGNRGWPLAVEFRNQTWMEPGIVRILDSHRAALCLHDMKWAAPVSVPNDAAPLVYVRRHGPSGRYKGSYQEHHVERDAQDIREWAKDRDVYVYYNNDHGGHAHRNATSLMAALGQRKVTPPQGQEKPAGGKPVRPARPPLGGPRRARVARKATGGGAGTEVPRGANRAKRGTRRTGARLDK